MIELSNVLSSEQIKDILSRQKLEDTITTVCKDGNGMSFVDEITYLKGRYPTGKEIISGITGQVETIVERRYVTPVIVVNVVK